MKKTLLLTVFLIASIISHAQVEIGVMLAPNISFNRVFDEADNYSFDANGVALRFSAGPMADFFIKDNIAISTGLWYSAKRSGFQVNQDTTSEDFSAKINMQYLQIPIGVKFYTKELMNTLKAYIMLGGTLDAKIAEKLASGAPDEIKIEEEFGKLIDVGLNIQSGVEFNINDQNKVFVGLMYNRGLINVATKDFEVSGTNSDFDNMDIINKENFRLNNDYISIIGGFKF